MDDQNKTNQSLDQSTAFGTTPVSSPVVANQPIEDITPVAEPTVAPAGQVLEPQSAPQQPSSTYVSPFGGATSNPIAAPVSSTPEPVFSTPQPTPIPSATPESASPFAVADTTPVASQPEMPEPKKNNVLPIVGGIAALLLLVGVAGAAYYVSNQLSNKQAVAPTAPTSKPAAAAPTPNPLLGNGSDGACNAVLAQGATNTLTDLNTGSCSGKSTPDAVNYVTTANVASGSTSLMLLDEPTGLKAGDEVMIINMQSSSTNFDSVGLYETHIISSISNSTLNFTSPLIYSYNGSTQKIMVQRVPNYASVNVAPGATLSASAWDGTKGGVLAFRVNGLIKVQGSISMSGKGYRGGKGASGSASDQPDGGKGGEAFCGYSGNGGGYYQAGVNATCGGGGGGGAVTSASPGCHGFPGGTGSSTGGSGGGGGGSWHEAQIGGATFGAGGGGGYGTPGKGGVGSYSGTDGGENISGKGGAGLFTDPNNCRGTGLTHGGGGGGGGTYGDVNLTKLFLGSGGGNGGYGAANGGNGGGIIMIYANSLSLSGTISSNGFDGLSMTGGAGGGGGAGGSIYIATDTQSAAASLITVSGGNGGKGYSSRVGGTGGLGRIVNITTPLPTSTITITPTVTEIVTPTGTENSCTAINVYKKVDGAYGTTALTATELKSLKAGDVLKFSLVSDTDNLKGRFRVTIGDTVGEWLEGTIDTTNRKLVTYSDYTVSSTGTYKFEAQVSTTP